MDAIKALLFGILIMGIVNIYFLNHVNVNFDERNKEVIEEVVEYDL